MDGDEFIVVPTGADGAAALKQLLGELGGDAVKSLVGTPDAPRRAVVTLSPDDARAVGERFAGRLLVEPNAPLFPTTSSH